MRKPENREKFKTAIKDMIEFYGKRDKEMVAEVLSEEAERIKDALVGLPRPAGENKQIGGET